MKKDKIIQIITTTLAGDVNDTSIVYGLSESGNLYYYEGDEWDLLVKSPPSPKKGKRV